VIPDDVMDFVISDSCPRSDADYGKYIHISNMRDPHLHDVKTSFKDSFTEANYVMDVFSFEECLKLINCFDARYLPKDDTEFEATYVVFGGIARRFVKELCYDNNIRLDHYDMVLEELQEFFNYQTDIIVEGSFLVSCAMAISKDLAKGAGGVAQMRFAVSSMFVHRKVDEDRRAFQEIPASVFMGVLAHRIREDGDKMFEVALRSAIGYSGKRCLFGNLSHKIIFNNLIGSFPCTLESLAADARSEVFAVSQIRKKFIRSINDLEHLQPGEYGIPLIPNFPWVDAVIVHLSVVPPQLSFFCK
jgi:hypothetical protein